MPELPEVETMRRGALSARGGVVVAARLIASRRKPLTMSPAWPSIARKLKGKRLHAIDRRGKRLLLQFDDEQWLIIEPRMTGLLLVGMQSAKSKNGNRSQTSDNDLRFELELRGARAARLAYQDVRGLGQVRLVNARGLEAYWQRCRLGPDALSISLEELHVRLGHRRTAVKVALMDQSSVAGIGNIYASEILHVARIDPRRPCDRLNKRNWTAVHKAMRDVLEEAIRYEGSTLSDGSYRNALNQPGDYQNHHRVYDREGCRCTRCSRGTIRRLTQAQRSTYWCPRCQR